MRRWMLIVLVATIGLADLAPIVAYAQDTIQLAQFQRRRTLMDLLFGPRDDEEPQRRRPEQQQQQQPQQEQQQPRRQPRQRQPRAELPPEKPAVPKAATAKRLAVFGDSLAVDLAKGLERAYADDPNLMVLPLGVESSGFVRTDFVDWNKTIADQIAANSFDVAVVMIGINDRQEITVDGKTYQPLTDGWKAAYQQRVVGFINQFRAAGKPVIWVGLPPMKSSSFSAAMSDINAVERLATFSGGAEFLDIYDRFLDEDGNYSSYGPDINGQSVRMRKDDGIHFSSAGADKLAFFLSPSIKQFYSGGGVGIDVADPLAGTDAASMVRLPFQGQGQTRMLEVAGAVVPLSTAPAKAGQLLTANTAPGTPAAPSGGSFDVEQLMRAPAGRVDAFGVGVDPAAPAPAPAAGAGQPAAP